MGDKEKQADALPSPTPRQTSLKDRFAAYPEHTHCGQQRPNGHCQRQEIHPVQIAGISHSSLSEKQFIKREEE